MVVNPDGSRTTADASGMSADVAAFDLGQQGSTDDVRRRWTETLSRRSFLQTRIESAKAWVERTFSLSVSSLSLSSAREEAYEPPSRATLLLAQGHSDGDGTWTVLTARSEDALADETARLTSPALWSQVAGHAVTLDPDQDKVEVQAIGPFTFVQTQPLSFRNLRLVAANWMSINILQYAVLLVACCTALGAATYFLLNRLGRRS
jgi:hypothetical protein